MAPLFLLEKSFCNKGFGSAWKCDSFTTSYEIYYQGISKMSLEWYALRSKPNKEEALWRELCARSFEVFYPQITVHPSNPRARKIKPYFPGYLFVNLDLSMVGFSALAWMPHSYGLIFFESVPAAVPEVLINALRRRVDQVNAAGGELFEGLKTGEIVAIQAGPFSGYDAIFDARLPGSERVRVLLKLLNKQQIPLVLAAGYIQRKKSPFKTGR
jgi:transcription antitermination factor NusG